MPMSKVNFKYVGSLLVVNVTLQGAESTEKKLELALDTGSTRTIIKPDVLHALGYEVTKIKNNLTITTGTKNEKAFDLGVKNLEMLDYSVKNLKVVCKTLPISLFFIDGLLGLDFFQKINKKLVIDFDSKTIAIT
jgi:predicted aspartyl protease